MLSKVLPIVFLLVGSGAGVGAAMFLRPEPEAPMETEAALPEAVEETPDTSVELDYVKMSNQFVVPVVKDEVVAALVVLALSIETPEGGNETIFRVEPKLRDIFLQVLFDHANIGGFDGAFTEANNLDVLRTALKEAGQKAVDEDTIRDVLIVEIARQDY